MPKINVESFSLSQKLRRHLNHDHLPVQSNIQKRRQRTRYLTRLTTSRRKNSLRWKKWSQAVKNQQKVAQTRFGTILNWFPTNRRTTATSSISTSIVFTFFITCCEYLIKLTMSWWDYVVNLIFIFHVFRGIMYHNQITSNSYSGLISSCTSTLLSR